MKTKIYLDTTVVSALFDKRTPERKTQTEQFWQHIDDYTVFISELVIDEIKGASLPLRNQMLERVLNFIVLPVTDNERILADIYVQHTIFPEKYADDALHAAIASTNQIGILLSWNFTHLVKIKTRKMIALVNTMHNYNPVEIIAPPEL